MKGQKTGGREQGTPNKTTAEIKNLFNELLSSNLESLQKDLEQLSPRDRINALLKMAEFILPKNTTIQATVEERPPQVIKWGDKEITL